MIKITNLELENIKRIKAVQLAPSESGLTVIGGNNGQGKTSVLDGIAWALGGDKFKPSQPQRDGSVIPPHLRVTLSNGLIVERKGDRGTLKITDPNGGKGGQQLLNEFIGQLALDLPKFMQATSKEKAQTLLRIIGVGTSSPPSNSRSRTPIISAAPSAGRRPEAEVRRRAPGLPRSPRRGGQHFRAAPQSAGDTREERRKSAPAAEPRYMRAGITPRPAGVRPRRGSPRPRTAGSRDRPQVRRRPHGRKHRRDRAEHSRHRRYQRESPGKARARPRPHGGAGDPRAVQRADSEDRGYPRAENRPAGRRRPPAAGTFRAGGRTHLQRRKVGLHERRGAAPGICGDSPQAEPAVRIRPHGQAGADGRRDPRGVRSMAGAGGLAGDSDPRQHRRRVQYHHRGRLCEAD